MALMIPDSIRSDASQGEKTLYSVLRDRLPDDFLVWYEPEIKGFYPDFVVLSPSFGLLILEVKGWYCGNIIKASKDLFEIKRKDKDGADRTGTEKSPLKQGHGYFATITDLLVGHSILRQPDGSYKGNLAFPIGVGAVMSNITEAQAKADGLYGVLEQPQVAYRDELLEWMNFSERDLVRRLREMFKVYFPFMALMPDQISTIKGVLYPEMTIRAVPATKQSVPIGQLLLPDSSVLLSLDVEQEKLARSMRDGHRLFSGVAGSGKTLILLARAKAIANRLTEHRVLILCFNITLASHLRSILHSDEQNPQYQRIEVRHFHDWAKSLLGRLPNYGEFDNSEEYDEFMGDRVLANLSQRDMTEKWDSVLVDEAHTFSPQWFLCCVAALKDPIAGDLMIVSDGSQSLYTRRKFTWKSVGIQAAGRSRRLAQNYRNTQEVLTAAWNVVQPVGSGQTGIEGDITFPVVEPSAALRQGAKPVLHLTNTKAKAVDALVERVRSLRESGYAPAEIAILYRFKTRNDDKLFQGMLGQLRSIGVDTYWITESQITKRSYNIKTPGVRVATALSSLGLEFKAVLLLWVEQFDECCSSDVEQAALARRQLYVAMTRAQDELHLFGSGSSAVLGELEASQGFDVRREAARELVSLPVLKRR